MNGTSRWQKVIGALGLVVVLWVGDRLVDVISSGGPGPGGKHRPAGDAPPTEPTGRDEPAPGEHDPSQFDHG